MVGSQPVSPDAAVAMIPGGVFRCTPREVGSPVAPLPSRRGSAPGDAASTGSAGCSRVRPAAVGSRPRGSIPAHRCLRGVQGRAQARIRRERERAALPFAKDRDVARLEAMMARLDAEAEARLSARHACQRPPRHGPGSSRCRGCGRGPRTRDAMRSRKPCSSGSTCWGRTTSRSRWPPTRRLTDGMQPSGLGTNQSRLVSLVGARGDNHP
jgi:hypothetical protein